MRNPFVLLCLSVVACLFNQRITAQPAEQNALLWEISGNGISNPSYLYGTVHMICPENFMMGKQLKEKFNAAEKIYLEVDMDDPGMNSKMLQLSLLKGRKLSDMFSDSDYTRLNVFFRDSVGIPLALLNTMKPFVLFSMLTLKSLPCTQPQSYELTFVKMAKEQDKEILGLETIEDQMKIFDDLPDSIQVQMVMRYVNEFEEQKKVFAKMVKAYRNENLDSLYHQVISSPDIAGSEDALLFNRNRNWIPVMEAAMQNGKVLFAVGAGHLSGAAGVIQLLRDRGYTVKGMRETAH